MLDSQPIIAVSSPPGRATRGLIRISGDNIIPPLSPIFSPSPAPRRLSPTRLLLADSNLNNLPALTTFFPAPNSYTAQDIIEIQCPGHPTLLDNLLHTLLNHIQTTLGWGRLANPGEFTQRAYTAGRIDLTRAEGIAATISAVSDAQLNAAKLLRTGRLGQFATSLVDELAQLLALTEAGIDFIDQDDVVPISPMDLKSGVEKITRQIKQLLQRSRAWKTIEHLPWVVLLGPPNVGKSTLFNTLLKKNRAVTSNTPGTTRDILTEPLKIKIPNNQLAEIMLVDIAGIENKHSALDQQMQQAARDAVNRAELLLILHEPHQPTSHPHLPNLTIPPSTPQINVITKVDTAPNFTPPPNSIPISATTNHGIPQLLAEITSAMQNRAVTLAGQTLCLQSRHKIELTDAQNALNHAHTLLQSQADQPALHNSELIAHHLRDALNRLGALGGHLSPDDVIGKIFSTFCIGK